MSQPQDSVNQQISQPHKRKSKTASLIISVIRELLAITIWIYVFIKLFIYDIDIFVINILSPNLKWIINYKFFFLIGIIAIIFLITKNRTLLIWSLYIVFYPFIFLFWEIPVFIFRKKSWNLLFALLDSIVSLFSSFKISFIVTASFLIAAIVILVSNISILLLFSIIILIIILSWAYIHKFISVFRPSGVYQVYTRIFSFLSDIVKIKPTDSGTSAVLSEEELKLSIEDMDEKQIQKWTTGVQWLALFNRVCLFVAKKIRLYQEINFNIISSIIGIMKYILFTIITFAIINYGLYKIDNNVFSYPSEPTFFNFIYYSFNNFLFNTIPEVVARAPIAQVTSMTESLFALFLVAIFISLLLSIKNQRETEEINKLIEYLKIEGNKAEGYLKDHYRISDINEAMQSLQKVNLFIANILYRITDTLNS